MRKSILLAAALLFGTAGFAQWQPVGDKIKTPWADQVDPQNPLPEYPRPLMERDRWQNLNGLWDYAIVPVGAQPEKYDGKILVPFAVESSLSGVQKRLGGENELWYSREFAVPAKWAGERVLLHFGAVDWKTDVWVNDVLVGRHTGGYTPFTFDITAALNKKGTNTLKVKVWDPTDVGYQPRGKQVNNPSGIWYTPVSGIWQTVWLEPVPVKYIAGIRTTPDIDRKTLRVEVDAAAAQVSDMVEVTVLDGGKEIARAKAVNGVPVEVAMPADMKLWSPDSPFLYDLKVALVSDGKEVDRVDSYTAMRKYSTARDADGIMRLQLNNKDIFHFGPLDQGWWPDGLYTAATDEALEYERLRIQHDPQARQGGAGSLVYFLRPSRDYGMAGHAQRRRRSAVADEAVFRRGRMETRRGIGGQLPQGVERDHGLPLFESLYCRVGSVQRSVGTVQNARDRRMDQNLRSDPVGEFGQRRKPLHLLRRYPRPA